MAAYGRKGFVATNQIHFGVVNQIIKTHSIWTDRIRVYRKVEIGYSSQFELQ